MVANFSTSVKSLLESIAKDIIKEAVTPKITLEEYLGTILFFSNRVHALHFLTSKGIRHTALQELYEESDELSDTIIETTMAYFNVEKFKDLGDTMFSYKDPAIGYLEKMREFIVKYRPVFYDEKEQSQIWSDIDNFISIINTAIYRLKYLE